jgi:hypothetical protein
MNTWFLCFQVIFKDDSKGTVLYTKVKADTLEEAKASYLEKVTELDKKVKDIEFHDNESSQIIFTEW